MWSWRRHKTRAAGAVASTTVPADTVTHEVRAAPCDKCAQVPTRIDAKLTDYRRLIHEHIEYARAVSEKEIMAIGESVQHIVDHTRQFIDESTQAVERSFAGQSATLGNYLDHAQQTADIQRNAVQQALALSEDITKAGAAVDRLASQARLLALNAKIEAARLGSEGNAFGVITEQMNHLSLEIAKTNRLIAHATQAIKTCLPVITEQTSAQIRSLEDFSQTMQQLKAGVELSLSTTTSAGDSHITMILNLAYAALSHLQFQDPMIQSMQKIDFLMRDLHDGVNKEFGTAASTVLSSSYVETLGSKMADERPGEVETHRTAGEVLLF